VIQTLQRLRKERTENSKERQTQNESNLLNVYTISTQFLLHFYNVHVDLVTRTVT